MFDILSVLPGNKKKTSSGWVSFNALCCGHRGHGVDRRGRGGIKFEGSTDWYHHCFNCGFTCNFTLGKSISPKTTQLLVWCGIDKEQIQRWSLESLQRKDFLDFTVKKKIGLVKFKSKDLPNGELLDLNNTHHAKYVQYLKNRGIDPASYPFMITPNDMGRNKNRLVIPFTYRNKIVGHTSRYLDSKLPKYINDQQPGYIFNLDIQRPNWQVCIVTEGIFDALSIDGVAVMHDDISNEQAMLLAQLNKRIIVVPDRDRAGLAICDKALELGYSVSLPEWDHSIKDTNDAVCKYGKLPTLISILQSATHSKIKIEMMRKKIGKTRS